MLEIFDVAASLDDLAGDLMAQHHAGGCGGAAAHHVLVGTTNIRRNEL